MTESRIPSLRQALPELRLLDAPADLEHYGRDATRRWMPRPLAIAQPANVGEVQGIVQWANRHRIALVPSGGRTGLSGGAVAANGELVVSLERMRRVIAFDAVDRTLTVEAGIPLQAVQDAAREHGLQYPVDYASRGSATIGGSIATNAGGVRVLRHGNTREWIAGLKLVTGTGALLDLNRGLLKNSSGYDLRHLAIGAEGTLGIVVEATLELADPPPPTGVMVFALPGFDAIMPLFAELRRTLRLEAFEFFTDKALRHVLAHGGQDPFDATHPYYVLVEFAKQGDADADASLAAFEHAAAQGWVEDGVVASSDAQTAELWRLREGISESLAPYTPYKNDVAVRISAMPAFLAEADALLANEYPDFEVVWFGHIGDGNLHINVLKPKDMAQDAFAERCGAVTAHLAALLGKHGGSISAEHGIGLAKKPYLLGTRSAAEIDLMRAIRGAFDPNGIMNPGKLFD